MSVSALTLGCEECFEINYRNYDKEGFTRLCIGDGPPQKLKVALAVVVGRLVVFYPSKIAPVMMRMLATGCVPSLNIDLETLEK